MVQRQRALSAGRQPALSRRHHSRDNRVQRAPLNNRLASVTPGSAEGAAVWTRYLSAWTAWNHVRTAASVAAAASFIMALK
jgi:uncharacterized membrane protein